MTNETNLFDNKIIILYTLENSGKALTIDQIAKLCEEFEDITYFDICTYVESLKNSNYIEENLEENISTYEITQTRFIYFKSIIRTYTWS